MLKNQKGWRINLVREELHLKVLQWLLLQIPLRTLTFII